MDKVNPMKAISRVVKKKELDDEEIRNKEIELYLKQCQNTLEFKVLLLGSGESGKSTVLKQLKNIYKVKLSETEINETCCALHSNCVQSMQILVNQCKAFSFTLSEKDQVEADKLVKFELKFQPPYKERMTEEIGSIISYLWSLDAIKKTFERRDEFWIIDSAAYFFNNVLRFVEEGYVPTEEDFVMARMRTTGMLITEFDEPPVHFKVVDVAGQAGERKKWINYFDDVKALIFVVNLAGYNLRVWEDPNKNQMEDSIQLFKQISNLPNFQKIPVFLFLNKKDLFEEMIRVHDLRKCFPDYTGGSQLNSALEYITNTFHSQIENDKKKLHVAYIAARFKKDVRYSWEEVRDILIQQNKKEVDKARKNQAKIEKQQAKLKK